MKLLLVVEPTERGEWALQLADELARGLGGPIVLLTTEEHLARYPRVAHIGSSIDVYDLSREPVAGAAHE